MVSVRMRQHAMVESGGRPRQMRVPCSLRVYPYNWGIYCLSVAVRRLGWDVLVVVLARLVSSVVHEFSGPKAVRCRPWHVGCTEDTSECHGEECSTGVHGCIFLKFCHLCFFAQVS